MLGKIAIALLALATCQGQEPEDATACRLSDYGCYPVDRLANGTCAHACGRPAHCQDYSTAEYAFCETHPGVPIGSTRRCALDGFPNWISHCEPGPAPAFPEHLRQLAAAATP